MHQRGLSLALMWSSTAPQFATPRRILHDWVRGVNGTPATAERFAAWSNSLTPLLLRTPYRLVVGTGQGSFEAVGKGML